MNRPRKTIEIRILWRVWTALALMGFLVGAPTTGFGDGPGGSSPSFPGRREDPEYTAAVKAVNAGDYAAAIRLLQAVVAKDGANADAYNWLAYSVRQTGDAAKAVSIYQKALAIDPRHRGAHEYLGEAYLVLGDLAKAKEHLARLDTLCLFPCSEYRDLKKAVQAYEASGGTVRPAAKKAR